MIFTQPAQGPDQSQILGNLRHGGHHFLHESRDRHTEVLILKAVKEVFGGLHRFAVLFREILMERIHVPGAAPKPVPMAEPPITISKQPERAAFNFADKRFINAAKPSHF